jgi:hypothetical protein
VTELVIAVATVVAAVGTVGAFIAAFVQIGQERDARQRQERKAELAARREQATHVSAWVGEDREGNVTLALSNRSDEPVYRAVASLVLIQGAGPQTGREVGELGLDEYQAALAVIPPGRHGTVVAGGFGGMSRRPGVELAFTDRSGVHWVRAADGSLREIGQEPARYYDRPQPEDWRLPEGAR